MADQSAKPIPMQPVDFGTVTGIRVGSICGLDQDGSIRVDYPGNPFGPRQAQTTETIGPGDIGGRVLLVFENNDPARPIIAGKIKPPAPAETLMELDRKAICDVLADGRKLVLEAREQVEIRCGKSAMILNKDGKVVIKGEQVISRGRRINKIKGGVVKIN